MDQEYATIQHISLAPDRRITENHDREASIHDELQPGSNSGRAQNGANTR